MPLLLLLLLLLLALFSVVSDLAAE